MTQQEQQTQAHQDSAAESEEVSAQESEEQSTAPQQESEFSKYTTDAGEASIDATKYRIKAFLSGPSGSGKTQSATTIPGKKLLIDFDNRSETVIGTPDLEILACHEPEPKSPVAWQNAEKIRRQMIAEINAGVFPYDAVIFDGLTMMGRASLNWALLLDPGRGLGGSPARQHYGPQMDSLAKYVLSTIALPLHIIYTGHVEYITEEETGRSLWLPKVTGKLRTEVANWFSETYYCYREFDSDQKRTIYYWITAGSGRKEFFKSSINSLSRYWKDPIEINYEDENRLRGFEDLMQRRFNPITEEQTNG